MKEPLTHQNDNPTVQPVSFADIYINSIYTRLSQLKARASESNDITTTVASLIDHFNNKRKEKKP